MVAMRDSSGTALAFGRFAGWEPLGFEAGDNNWYRFVANGPTGKTDPGGLADGEAPLPLPPVEPTRDKSFRRVIEAVSERLRGEGPILTAWRTRCPISLENQFLQEFTRLVDKGGLLLTPEENRDIRNMQDPRHRDFVADDNMRLLSLAAIARQKLLNVAEQAVRNIHGEKWPQLPNHRPCDRERTTLDMLRTIAVRAIPAISIHGDPKENVAKIFRGDVRDAVRELDWSAFWTIVDLRY